MLWRNAFKNIPAGKSNIIKGRVRGGWVGSPGNNLAITNRF